jgi:hypothetical protein
MQAAFHVSLATFRVTFGSLVAHPTISDDISIEACSFPSSINLIKMV